MTTRFKTNLFIILIISFIITFLFLGIWQLQRKNEKDKLQKEIDNNMNIPVKLFEHKSLEHHMIYKRYIFRGNFENINYYVYGANDILDNNGYFVLTPFTLESGLKIMVVKGWLDKPYYINRSSINEIEGIVVKSTRNIYTPIPDLVNNIYYGFDMTKIIHRKDIEQNCFILSVNAFPKLKKVNVSKFTKLYNRHLGYVITWFTLSFFLLIILSIYLKKRC